MPKGTASEEMVESRSYKTGSKEQASAFGEVLMMVMIILNMCSAVFGVVFRVHVYCS